MNPNNIDIDTPENEYNCEHMDVEIESVNDDNDIDDGDIDDIDNYNGGIDNDTIHIFTGLLNYILEDSQDQYRNDSLINASLYERNPVKHVITQEEKEKLQIIKYKDAVNKEKYTSCYITQDDFCEEDKIIQLPCEHCFFADSILQWLSEESCECPVCKYRFASVELRENNDVVSTNADWNVQNDYIVPNINRNIFNYNSLQYEYMNDAFLYNSILYNNYNNVPINYNIPMDNGITIMETLNQYYDSGNTINNSYFEEDDDEL